MAWRFPSVLPVSGDVLHPGHWNSNIDVYSSELNGFLDRDNLEPEVVKKGMVRSNSFVKVFSSTFADDASARAAPADDFDINMKTTAWHDKDTSPTPDDMPFVEFTADTDGWVQCDFHASYQWTSPSDPNGGSQAWFRYNEGNAVFYSSTVGVVPVLIDDIPGGLAGTTPESVKDDWKARVVDEWSPNGANPVWRGAEGGIFTSAGLGIQISGKNFNGGFAQEPADKDSVAFRVLVDGVTVAETGWMSIGLYRNGAYLTGVAPVSAGQHTIRTQVRSARVSKMEATSGGLAGAGDLTLVTPVAFSTARVPNTGGHVRVRGRGLNVTFRKR